MPAEGRPRQHPCTSASWTGKRAPEALGSPGDRRQRFERRAGGRSQIGAIRGLFELRPWYCSRSAGYSLRSRCRPAVEPVACRASRGRLARAALGVPPRRATRRSAIATPQTAEPRKLLAGRRKPRRSGAPLPLLCPGDPCGPARASRPCRVCRPARPAPPLVAVTGNTPAATPSYTVSPAGQHLKRSRPAVWQMFSMLNNYAGQPLKRSHPAVGAAQAVGRQKQAPPGSR